MPSQIGIEIPMTLTPQSASECRTSSQSAFTLTEVLVALLVVSIMVVSLYTGVSSGFALVKLAREDLRATQIMLQRVETLRLYKWSNFTDASYFSTNNYTEYYDPAGQAS